MTSYRPQHRVLGNIRIPTMLKTNACWRVSELEALSRAQVQVPGASLHSWELGSIGPQPLQDTSFKYMEMDAAWIKVLSFKLFAVWLRQTALGGAVRTRFLSSVFHNTSGLRTLCNSHFMDISSSYSGRHIRWLQFGERPLKNVLF